VTVALLPRRPVPVGMTPDTPATPATGRLQGRRAVVTGASSGLGKALAEHFASEGATVFIGSRRGEDVARVAKGITSAGGKAFAHALDVTSWESVQAFAAAAGQALGGGVDIVVNNAGVGRWGPVEETSVEDWDLQIATNLRGPFLVTKAFLPLLKAGPARPRHILNIASVSGQEGQAGLSGYCASKFGLRGFTLSLAPELAPLGIRVTGINPGYIATPMVEDAEVPLETMIQPRDLAEACIRVITLPESAYVDELTVWPAKLYTM